MSVKTRIGYDRPAVENWIPRLLEVEPVAICLHGRTLQQAYKGQADWEAIGVAAQLCKQTATLILGNGDAASRQDAEQRATDYGVDGVLIGRASYGNPFIFHTQAQAEKAQGETQNRFVAQRRMIQLALEHVRLFEETYQSLEHYHFPAMRKHLSWYIKDMAGASHMRASLMQTKTAQEVETVFQQQEQRSLSFRKLVHD